MKKLLISLPGAICALFLLSHAPVHASPADDCEAKALSKEGKPLAGAAKSSFMKKCEREVAAQTMCESKAVSKDGKPLSGAAKASSIKKCLAEAK